MNYLPHIHHYYKKFCLVIKEANNFDFFLNYLLIIKYRTCFEAT